MIAEINKPITSGEPLRDGYIYRDGFVFTITDIPSVFDTLIIREPQDAVGSSYRAGFSTKTLEEHIDLINKYHLKKAVIVCDDLTFILSCPSLSNVTICPSDESGDGFDYSPLYQMPQLRELCCRTTYGYQDEYRSTIDYSKTNGVVDIGAAGQGHVGYSFVPTLEKLWLSGNKEHYNFSNVSCSTKLKEVTMLQCSIRSLKGIDKHNTLETLSLFYNRSLSDISSLESLAKSLRVLSIENCPKVTDFSALSSLENLEHLHLYGNNILPNLHFLGKMKKLKTFCFSMNVEDGDLQLCMDIPYASCKNRKHYNFKDAQLPKKLK